MVGNNLQATLSGLESKILYTVRVQAWTNGGPGPFSRPVQVKTQHGIPGQVTDVTVSSSSLDSFRVKWTPPATSGHPISGYKIYYNSTTGAYGYENVDAPTVDYTVRSLRPGTDYVVYVIAMSTVGESPPSDSVKVSTKASKPIAPPRDLKGKYLDSRRIEVTWQPPEDETQRGRIISYKIYYQPNDQQEGDPLVVTADGEARRFVLRDLSVWTEYKIWMTASTGIGDGILFNSMAQNVQILCIYNLFSRSSDRTDYYSYR